MARKKGEGRLRIGDQWNAIRIIALSQSNPLKAIVEFVENSIDADGVVRKMRLVKDSPAYSIHESRELFDRPGTTLHIQPILSGVRVLSGEKIQSYLASELRDRITRSGVEITIVDRSARKELTVVPRKYHGVLIHGLPSLRSPLGEIYVELYLCSPSAESTVGLHRSGTRVIDPVTKIDALDHAPWSSGYLEGIVDADFINLTPGTRSGIVYDDRSEELVRLLRTLEPALNERIAEQQRAEEDEASKSMLRRITRALREAFSMLPEEQYGWLASQASRGRKSGGRADGGVGSSGGPADEAGSAAEPASDDLSDGAEGVTGEFVADSGGADESAPAFFEMPGPLYRVDIRPAKATVAVGGEQTFSAVGRDRSRRVIEGTELDFEWELNQGAGSLSGTSGEFVTYRAPVEPELAVIAVLVTEVGGDGEKRYARAEAMVTVTAELLRSQGGERAAGKGLPGYTFSYLPGSLWRSRYSEPDSLITINSGHPDFVHASRQPRTKLRYVARLYAKEIVLANFPGGSREELLERLVELTLYMDDNLR